MNQNKLFPICETCPYRKELEQLEKINLILDKVIKKDDKMFLISDVLKCNSCNECEKLYNGFKSKYDGKIIISSYRYVNDECVKNAVSDLINCCPQSAIRLG